MCGGDFMSKNSEEAMDFLSYVYEVSRGWDEPNTRDVGRMKSHPNAKGGMYVLSEDMDMKAKFATMARRLEELELKKVQEVQAISVTPVQAMPCSICQSYEPLGKCSTIPIVREMFGDQANVVDQFKPNNNAPYGSTYNSNWRNHPNFSWKPRPPQYTPPAQAPQQVSNLEQAIMNLSKVVGDFVGEQKSINCQLNQKIDRVESILNKRMDGMQNDLSQKIDNGIYEVEAQKGESSKVRKVKAAITLKSGKKVVQPAPKLKHDEGSESKKTWVNIPLLDMIKQVPTYAKFLKDLCTIKRGLNVTKKAFLTEQVSAIIQCKSLVKYKDLGCPTISVNIGGTCVEKALLDLGASEWSYATHVWRHDLGLNIFHLCKKHLHPEEEEGLEEVCMIDTLVEEHCEQSMEEDLIESLRDLDEGLPEPSDFLNTMSPWRRREEILPLFNEEELHRVAKEEPPKLTLKLLPTGLKYAYLEEDKQCPVVISSALSIHQEDCLIEFLRRYSLWVSPTQVVPKKSGITVVQNDKGEDVSTHLTTGWGVSGHLFYCFLDGYSGYFQIEIDLEDQEKTTFTCPFVFMDDITVYGSAFEDCLVNLEAVLNRCIEKDSMLNWEKCHFMVQQGIVLGHIIFKEGIEVDKAKVELIVKLPSPTNVKGVRQFLGHVEFYRRFIKDFSKLARPLCELLVKDAKFVDSCPVRPRLRESFVQAMARQVEDQSHEEPELWSTSKPLAKLGKGLAKLSVVRWREIEHFRKAKSSNSQGVPKFAKCAKIWQGVPNFHRVCENHFVRTDLREKSPEL
ncbi:Retrovirus-related Pol polyprotein from transposon opus [Vitis vinifera]|uniref:Retrovirus-related Pol polyprotein from transposon opus n=1 Tax=Vitis vinifera TaxID=29760 RepID=A0A438JDP7_VITVI|nr:Retrovirus-related Pol polyprotein from transposon opus [Vitis vinifera]